MFTDMLKLEGFFELKLENLMASQKVLVSTPITARLSSDTLPNMASNITAYRSVPICKWHLQLSALGHSVNSFLEKVEEIRLERSVSKEELILSACDLFKGQSWTWVISNKYERLEIIRWQRNV